MKRLSWLFSLIPLGQCAALGLYLDGGIGYRTGDFNWSIGALEGEPNIASELRWEGLKAIDYYAEGRVPYLSGQSVGFELHYAPIYSGQVTDADYALDDRKGEYSRSVSSANKGYLVDLTFKSDNLFPILGNLLMANVTGGYCYHRQHLSIIGGRMVVSKDPLATMKGVNNRYTTLWSGAFLGVDLISAMTYPLLATAGYRYEYMAYHAKGRWNSREDFIGPFSHHSNGAYANLFYAKATYYVLPCICLILHAEWQYFWAKKGTDETTVREQNGAVLYKSRLNSVGWNSRLYLVHLAFNF